MEYIKGQDNVIADALSRISMEELKSIQVESTNTKKKNINVVTREMLKKEENTTKRWKHLDRVKSWQKQETGTKIKALKKGEIIQVPIHSDLDSIVEAINAFVVKEDIDEVVMARFSAGRGLQEGIHAEVSQLGQPDWCRPPRLHAPWAWVLEPRALQDATAMVPGNKCNGGSQVH